MKTLDKMLDVFGLTRKSKIPFRSWLIMTRLYGDDSIQLQLKSGHTLPETVLKTPPPLTILSTARGAA